METLDIRNAFFTAEDNVQFGTRCFVDTVVIVWLDTLASGSVGMEITFQMRYLVYARERIQMPVQVKARAFEHSLDSFLG